MTERMVSDERLQEILFYLRIDHTNGYGKLDTNIEDLLTAIEERDAEIERHQKLVRKLFGETIQPTMILGPGIAKEVEWAMNHD